MLAFNSTLRLLNVTIIVADALSLFTKMTYIMTKLSDIQLCYRNNI